ncbi:MAG: penicillin-binding protein activator [Pseudomonadota bacterium]
MIALLAPSTAPNAASVGAALVNAARMAAVDQGDPLLQLRVYDTAGNAAQARLAAEQAINDDAQIILGPLFGANTKAVKSVASAAGIKVLSFSTDSSVAGDPVYLTGFLPEIAAARITQFARARGLGAIGVFYPNNAYGSAASRGAAAAVGPNIVASAQYERTQEGIPTATQDFAGQAQSAGVQALLIAESGQALRYVGTLLQTYGVPPEQVKYLGLGEWNSRSTLQEGALKGGWFAAPDPAAVKAFVEKYQAQYGSVPPIQAVLAYDAVRMAGTLLAEGRAQNTAPFTTESLTRGRGFQGVVGPIALGRDGLGRRGMAVLEVGEGVFQTIDPVPVSVTAGS